MFISGLSISYNPVEIVTGDPGVALPRSLTFQRFSNNLRRMRNRILVVILAAALPALAELQTGPAMPYHVVRDWAQLPAGWNFGEVSAVDVDKNDNVWVFNRGPHPVIEFDKSGKMLRPWPEGRGRTSDGVA